MRIQTIIFFLWLMILAVAFTLPLLPFGAALAVGVIGIQQHVGEYRKKREVKTSDLKLTAAVSLFGETGDYIGDLSGFERLAKLNLDKRVISLIELASTMREFQKPSKF